MRRYLAIGPFLFLVLVCKGLCEAGAQETGSTARLGPLVLAQRIEKMPSWTSQLREIRTTTDQGVPLDELIHFRLRGYRLRVPAGYLWPWPLQSMRNRINELNEIAFEFWMPDRRYPTINPISIVGFRPREQARGEPVPDAHIVRVRSLMPIKADDQGYISPERAFHNFTKRFGVSSYSFLEEPFGLVRFWQHDWPYPHQPPFIDYRHREGSSLHVLLKCAPPHLKLPFPGCEGRVHFTSEGLGFFVHFSRDRLHEWREITTAVRDLFNSWKVAP